MALELDQQISNALERSRSPLIALRENPSIDGVSSALAISHLFKNMGKTAEIVSANFRHPGYSFLPEEHGISGSLSRLKPFVIKLDVSKTKIDELTYDIADGNLNLYLTPRSGSWKKDDVSVAPTSYRHDLVITLECPDLGALGELFKNEPELFTSIPILNIDHDPENEHYGHMNAVDIAATSCAEIIYPLLANRKLINEELATLLMAGIIGKTRSFKTEKVSPRSLRYAAELISAGAKREKVVHELYKTKDVATLKLWGRALARLKFEPGCKLVWTLITKDDFMHAGAGEEALPEVIAELLALSKDARVAALLYEQRAGGICVKISAPEAVNALALGRPWSGTGTSNEISFCLRAADIVSAEREVIEYIKKTLRSLPE